MERKIYKDWKVIEEVPHEAKLVRYGLNFGFTNHPLGMVAVYYYNGGYIVDEIMYGRGIDNIDVVDRLKLEGKALVIADSAEPKSIKEIKDYDIEIVGVKKQPGKSKETIVGSNSSFVKWSIQVVQGERISITQRSVNVRREYQGYMWIEDRNGLITNTPEEPFHYIMDAVRYAIVSLAPVINKREYLSTKPQLRDNSVNPVNPARWKHKHRRI